MKRLPSIFLVVFLAFGYLTAKYNTYYVSYGVHQTGICANWKCLTFWHHARAVYSKGIVGRCYYYGPVRYIKWYGKYSRGFRQ